ncbi:hypothetical protein AB8880_02355 [Alphaproteobacteria bacterium LSUCC0684]
MDSVFPLWLMLMDYALGAVMWTLIGRFGMSIFLAENSSFFFMRMFVLATNPIIRLARPITPAFLIDRVVPLYVAWFVFMFRFYVLPLMMGYSVMGVLSFPLEGDIAKIIYDIGQIFR